jgi:hypothetical protein
MDYYSMITTITLFAIVACVVMHAIDRVIVTEIALSEMRKVKDNTKKVN